MKEKQKVDKRESLTKECKKLLVELFVRAKTDERVQHFLDDFGEFLKKENQSNEEFKAGLIRLQEKHFPNFEKGVYTMDKEIKNVREMSDEEFMKKYERLVHHCVWRRYGKKLNSIKNDTALDIEDLTQFGMIGLIKARKQFNTEYGCQFSTYAVPKIFGEIGRAIRDHQKVRTQRIVYDIKGKIIRQKLEGKTPVEISEILGEPVNLVKIALKY